MRSRAGRQKGVNNMVYIGIDPGKKGGIAVIEDLKDEKEIHAHPYSDDVLKKICKDILADWSVQKASVFCVVEKVGAMPKQGVTSTFNFGKSFGYILGVLEANGIPYQLISPQRWKKHFSLTNDKNKSIQTAKRLFPSVSLLPTDRCRVESDGMAEALLMAEFARRMSGGKL